MVEAGDSQLMTAGRHHLPLITGSIDCTSGRKRDKIERSRRDGTAWRCWVAPQRQTSKYRQQSTFNTYLFVG